MSCEKCRELLWEYLAQELTTEDTEFVTAHLKECGNCQEEAKQLEKIMDSIKSLPEEELPEGYHEELMGKLVAEGKVITLFPQKKPQYKWKQFGLIAAGVLLVAVFGGTQGILNMRGQKEITQKMTVESVWDNQDFAVAQDAGVPEADLKIMQAEDTAPEMKMAKQAENNVPEKKMSKQVERSVPETQNVQQVEEKMAVQEPPTKEKQSGGENTQLEQPKLSGTLKAETSMDQMSDEVSPQLARTEARGMLVAQNDEAPQVIQQIILTVENKEGMLEKIRDLAISLGGYEGEQTLADSIKIFIPSTKTKEFMDGLKALGQTRSMEEPSQNAEFILYEVTLESK